MTDAPVFIVGVARSGTTLLRDLLRSHPSLSFPPEFPHLLELHRLHGDPRTDVQARRAAADLLGVWEVRQWGLDLRPGDLVHARSFAELAAAVYRAWAQREGKARWGDKTPQHVRQIPALLALFPRAKVLHIIRDGRDVALSGLEAHWPPSNAYTAALWWRTGVEKGRAAGERLPPTVYHELRYEALVGAAEPTMRGICAFLGEPFGPEVLRTTPPPRRLASRVPMHVADPNRPDGGNTGRWRTGLSERDRVVFESVAGEQLCDLGYAAERRIRRLAVAERMVWRVHQRADVLRWRINSPWRRARLRTAVRLTRSALRARLEPARARHGGRSRTTAKLPA